MHGTPAIAELCTFSLTHSCPRVLRSWCLLSVEKKRAARKAKVPDVSAISAAEHASLLAALQLFEARECGRGRRCPRRRARSGSEELGGARRDGGGGRWKP